MYPLGLLEGAFAIAGLYFLIKKTLECAENKETIELSSTDYDRIKNLINYDEGGVPPPYFENNSENNNNSNINIDNDNVDNSNENDNLINSNEAGL